MAIVKSKLLKQLLNNYPNFLKKDLEKFLNIILIEIKKALQRNESCEIRGFGRFSSRIQKKRIRRLKTICYSVFIIFNNKPDRDIRDGTPRFFRE